MNARVLSIGLLAALALGVVTIGGVSTSAFAVAEDSEGRPSGCEGNPHSGPTKDGGNPHHAPVDEGDPHFCPPNP